MYFQNRTDAGQKLAGLLDHYKDQEVVVYALPRGGVVVAREIAKKLHAPLDLILAHKIGHPYSPEYAIAAVSESGHLLGSEYEMKAVGAEWLEQAKQSEMKEIARKRKMYLQGRASPAVQGKVAILVDDGIATGLTMQAGILELKDKAPKKIVVAVPVAPQSTAERITDMVDDFVALDVPAEGQFMGAVGAYYSDFSQVEDDEVITTLEEYYKASRGSKEKKER